MPHIKKIETKRGSVYISVCRTLFLFTASTMYNLVVTSINRKMARNGQGQMACVGEKIIISKKLINIQESFYKNLFTAFFKRFKIKHP